MLQHDQFSQESKPKSGLAKASMIMGFVGFPLFCGMFGLLSLPGLILGIVALIKAKQKPLEYGGQRFATNGIILNGLLILIFVAVTFPSVFGSRRFANEGSAVSSLRTLLGAEEYFFKESRSPVCGDLSELAQAELIDSTLASGEKNGYKFVVSKKADGQCEFFATPLSKWTGTRSFYASTESGNIHAASKDGLPASAKDPVLQF